MGLAKRPRGWCMLLTVPATGGFEPPAAAVLRAPALPMIVVNPGQKRGGFRGAFRGALNRQKFYYNYMVTGNSAICHQSSRAMSLPPTPRPPVERGDS